MAEHKAVRVNVVPEDEAVSFEEAARMLGVQEPFIREMLSFGVLKRPEGERASGVRLDSLLDYQKSRTKHPRDGLDEVFDELKAKGLY